MPFVKWDWQKHPQPRDALQQSFLRLWRAKELPRWRGTPDDKADYLDFLDFVAFELKRWLDTLPPEAEIGTGDLVKAFVPPVQGVDETFYTTFTNRIEKCRKYGRLDGYWHDVPNHRTPTKPFKKYHNRRTA